MNGIVNIHGKEYKTVALRVTEFRESFPIDSGWGIRTEIIEIAEDRVVMKAAISFNGVEVAVGHAEEMRNSSKINRTSALENCETSAIGRALAACGLAGTEYASADEVQNAIESQTEMVAKAVEAAKLAVDKEDWAALCDMDKADDPIWMEAWKKLKASQRRIKELMAKRNEYREQLNGFVEAEDYDAFKQLNDELSRQEARVIYRVLDDRARQLMSDQRKEEAA